MRTHALPLILCSCPLFAQPAVLGHQDAKPREVYPEIAAFRVLRDPGIEWDWHLQIGFGHQMALDGDRLYLGAWKWGPNASINQYGTIGRVYVYNTKDGELINAVNPPINAENSFFGRTIDASSGIVSVNSELDKPPYGISLYGPDMQEFTGTLYSVNSVIAPPSHVRIYGDRVITWYGGLSVFAQEIDTGDTLHTFGVTINSGLDFPLHDPLEADEEVIAISDIISSPADPVSRVRVFDATSFDLLYMLEPLPTSRRRGCAIALNDDYLAVAIPNGSVRNTPGTNSGGVGLYDKMTGEPVWFFTPLDIDQDFGSAIAMNERFLCVAAFDTDDAYLIDLSNPERVFRLKYQYGAPNPNTTPVNARSIRMSEDVLVISNGENEAYMFRLDCPGDLNANQRVDHADVELYLNWFTSNDPRADLNTDGAIDQRDLSLLIEYAQLFCP